MSRDLVSGFMIGWLLASGIPEDGPVWTVVRLVIALATLVFFYRAVKRVGLLVALNVAAYWDQIRHKRALSGVITGPITPSPVQAFIASPEPSIIEVWDLEEALDDEYGIVAARKQLAKLQWENERIRNPPTPDVLDAEARERLKEQAEAQIPKVSTLDHKWMA
jgi:hypothetical protein